MMKHRLASVFFACSLVIGIGTTFAHDVPDSALTPGASNPDVTQSNISETICKANWTKTIRPSSSYTNKLKKEQIEEYGYTDKTMSHYEEDHLISLQLGGHPTDRKNLWPQPYNTRCGARIKDVLETRLKRNVCAITSGEADRFGVYCG